MAFAAIGDAKNSFFDFECFCNSSLFVPINTNTSFWEVLTPCLSFVGIPTFTNIIYAPICAFFLFIYSKIYENEMPQLSANKLSFVKKAISLGFGFLSICELAIIFLIFNNENRPVEVIISALTNFVFSIFAIISYKLCFKSGIISSGMLHVLWLIKFISITLSFTFIIHEYYSTINYYNFKNSIKFFGFGSIYFFYTVKSFFMVILLCKADNIYPEYYSSLINEDDIDSNRKVSPENKCSAISSFILWYASPIFRVGLSKIVEYKDIWLLDYGKRAIDFQKRFHKTGILYNQLSLNKIIVFFLRLSKTTWEPIATSIILAILIVGLRYLNSIFLKLIIDSVQNQLPLWYSLFILFLLYLAIVLQNIFIAKRDYSSFNSYLHIRAIVIAEVYSKMLRLSAVSRSKYSTGEIMNLITADVQRLRLFWFELRDFVYCPLMIIVAIIGLYSIIGWNMLYGMIIFTIIFPINYVLSNSLNNYEQLQMKYKDDRLKLVNDMLNGMKIIKLYAWETPIQKMIAKLRNKELITYRKLFIINGCMTVSFQLAPIIALFVSFYGYTVLQGNILRPDVAFVGILFFSMLRYALFQLPNVLSLTIKAVVSGKRILKFLNEPEQQISHINRVNELVNDVVIFENCTYAWGSHQKETDNNSNNQNSNLLSQNALIEETNVPNIEIMPQLKNINLNIKRNELIGIVGRVGSGKSSLLSAILGEMDCVEKRKAIVNTKKIGYVPQQAWIQNKTLRENILFENNFDQSYYNKTIKTCALVDDLKLLSAGDMTEIGEKGINLSGGQRARVSLARAVYQKADLYIIDDVLSAVDSHVGKQIFDNVIGLDGLLRNTTRIFALNSLKFLKDFDRIIVLDEGRIFDIDTYDELLKKSQVEGGPFADLMREYLEKKTDEIKKDENEEETILNNEKVHEEVSAISIFSPSAETFLSCSVDSTSSVLTQLNSSQKPTILTKVSHNLSFSHQSIDSVSTNTNNLNDNDSVQNTNDGKLIEDESLATGLVSRRVYVTYLKAFGAILSIIFILLVLASCLLEAFSNVWLAKWTSQNNNSTKTNSQLYNLSIYGVFGFGNSFAVAFSNVCLAFGAYSASTKFHDNLVYSLLRAPMSFFDQTPIGRIINRLSNDIEKVDEFIPFFIAYLFIILGEALNSVIAILMIIPSLFFFVIPVFASVIIIMHYYNVSSVQFRRLTSNSVSKCYAFVQDSYSGGDSIRAYNVVKKLSKNVCKIIDYVTECTFTEILANRWIQVRLDLYSNTVVTGFLFFAIILGDMKLITIGALAMVINSGIMFSGYIGEIARYFREVEVHIVGIERIDEYLKIKPEAEWKTNEKNMTLPRHWPSSGDLVFENLEFRYRPNTPIVLKKLNLHIFGGTKVGIVGRTGAGKSSITLALFRIVELAGGKILIDNVDISKIGIHDLRKILTIIPQEPVLFCGSLRSNLDPFDEFNDDALWLAIERAHLKSFVSEHDQKLNFEIAEAGINLSVGQRQLICLARALLRCETARILILDEATAAIDPETDRLIQISIRTFFNNCTILTIAHRLNTVIDYDRILVMDSGTIAEYDTPEALFKNPDSKFAALCKNSGLSIETEN